MANWWDDLPDAPEPSSGAQSGNWWDSLPDAPADAGSPQAPAPVQQGGFWDTAGQYASQLASGMNEGIADLASLPSTAFNLISNVGPAAWNAVTGDNVRPAIVAPDTGAPLRGGMEAAGMIAPEDPGGGRQFTRRVGREVGASLVPALGLSGSGARAAGAVAQAVGSGVGAATAQQIAPDNVGAELAGQLVGGFAPLAAYDRFQRLAADRSARAAVPSVADLKSQAGDLYEQGARTGATAPQQDVAGLAGDLRATAQAEGLISPTGRVSEAYPKVREAIKLMDDYAAGDMNPRQMLTIRKTLADAAGSTDPAERRMATKFMNQFDDFTERFVPEFAEARSLYSRAMRGQQMEDLRGVAEASSSMYSQAGAENALRSQYRNLDKAIQRGGDRGYTPELQDAIRRVNQGTPAANAARQVGKLAPKGVVSLAAGPGLAFGIGNAVGGPGMGAVASGLTAGAGFAGAELARYLTSRAALEAELIARAGGAIRPAGALLAGPSAANVAGAVSGIAAGSTTERERKRKRQRGLLAGP